MRDAALRLQIGTNFCLLEYAAVKLTQEKPSEDWWAMRGSAAAQVAGDRPVCLYVIDQTFYAILTLIAAYLAFGGVLFARPG